MRANEQVISDLAHILDLLTIQLDAPFPEQRDFKGKFAEQDYFDAYYAVEKQRVAVLNSADIQKDVYAKIFKRFNASLPHYLSEVEEFGRFSVRLIDIIPNITRMVDAIVEPFYEEHGVIFQNIRNQLDANKQAYERADSPREKVNAYFKGTAFMKFHNFFEQTIPLDFPFRNEHHWIVAPQGAGKTNCISYFAVWDFQQALTYKKCCVVVMDSQHDLIHELARIPIYDEVPFLMIDAGDLIPINLFSMGKARRKNEALINHALDLLLYCFNSLMDSELTAKQTSLFTPIIRACMEIPNATLDTFQDFLEDNYEQYMPYIEQAGPITHRFFLNDLKDKKGFSDTKKEVAWRLAYLRQVSVFDRMFSPNPSNFDFYEELNKPQVIFIDTNRELLGSRTAIFGRMWIALLLQASQQRAAIAREKRLETFFYIDECQDYIAGDSKVTEILDQARKMNIGLILAHQRVGQMQPNVLDALGNCAIRMSRGTNDTFVAKALQTSTDFVMNQPIGSFAAYIRGRTPVATSIEIPLLGDKKWPRMNDHQYNAILKRSRDRYHQSVIEYTPPPRRETPEPEPEAPPKSSKAKKPIDPSF